MSHFHNDDSEIFICNRINNPIGALSNPVFLFAGELFVAGWPWIVGEESNSSDDALTVFLGKGFDFFDGGRFDENFIVGHVSSSA